MISPAPAVGSYRLAGAHSPPGTPKCLDVQGASSANGARIQQWDCGPAFNSNQDWIFVHKTNRRPLTHLKAIGYYGVTYTATAGVPDGIWAATKDHVNTAVFVATQDATNLPPQNDHLRNLALSAAAGVKGSVVLGGTALPYDLFRMKGRNAGSCTPASPDDIYSRCEAEGGLRVDYAAAWAYIRSRLYQTLGSEPWNSIQMFYLLDEPYGSLYASGFSVAESRQMLELTASLIKADFPTIPIAVVETPQLTGQGFPSTIDWIGMSCYDVNGCYGTLYMTLYNVMKNSLLPNQRMIILGNPYKPREWCQPNVSPCAFYRPHLSADPNRVCDIQPQELITTQAERDALINDADFFMNLALSEPKVAAVLLWHAISRLYSYASPAACAEGGVMIGAIDLRPNPGGPTPVMEKWKFLGRALGFGTP